MSEEYDLIIIGGGAMGLSSAWNAVSAYGDHPVVDGKKVLVLERYKYFNQLGSTAGASRQFRVQYSQDYLASLAVDSEGDWRRLQRETKEPLVPRAGSLWFGDPSIPTQEGGIAPAEATMDQLGIPYTPLDAKQIAEQYRFMDLPEDYRGFFQATGGIINVPETLETMFNSAQKKGVQFHSEEPVTGIEVGGDDEVAVKTSKGEYRGKKLIITPGPYANETLQHIGIKLNIQIWAMVSAYFRKRNEKIDYPTWFAFQQATDADSNLYYGFPEASWRYPGHIRVAPDYPYKVIDAPEDRGKPTPDDFEGTAEWVAKHMPDLDPTPEMKSTCLIALPLGDKKELILDFAPQHKNVVIYAGGWAAKFIPQIGKILVQMALTGKTSYNIAPYRIGRPGCLVK